MPRLILTHQGAVIREFPLEKERVTVGRRPNNDIQLDDPTVSGTHAVFLVLQHVYVEDLNSTNGILLNGKKVTKRQLNHGDVVRIGRHELKFVDDNALDFEKTVIIPASKPATDTQQESQTATSLEKAVVQVVNGPKAGQQIPLNKPYTTLGTPGQQVAVIARRGSSYFLMPMTGVSDKKHPPQVNDVPIGAESVCLKLGDIIEVAGTKLLFTTEEKDLS